MAIKKARKEAKKPPPTAANSANAGGSSVAMAEMPPHGPGAGLDHVQPPPPTLPPGECLGFLNRSIAGDSVLPDARGYIFHADVYGESPDVLCRRHPPASAREGDPAWWFLGQTRFRSLTALTKRADRSVKTGGYWHLEQGKKKLNADGKNPDADGLKNCFGFYTGPSKIKCKTPWLMQEFTSAKDDGAGKPGVPALFKAYVTPNATDDQLRDIFGEDGVKMRPDGGKKPARAMVTEEYFDAFAALLPVSACGENVQLPLQPPPPAYLGQYQQQQLEQYLGQYYHQQQQQQEEQYLMADGGRAEFND